MLPRPYNPYSPATAMPIAHVEPKLSTAICTEFVLSPSTRFILSPLILRLRSGTTLLRCHVVEVRTSAGLGRSMVGGDQGEEK
ncbi:MAG: hypothetical protein EAZ09_10685 [Oscillatoriales cyanobacterium]|nr:MAG: hypothetical protein EAZ09_10685 [Oscillatoriales cyanobacterium]